MKINELLAKFGLSEREQEVYLLLTKKGWSTALQLARVGNVKRTTLYRVLEVLAKKGLVDTQLDDKTTYYNAAEPKQFESMVINAETKAKNLRVSYKDLDRSLSVLSRLTQKGETAVRFYRGLKGLEHLEWKRCEQPGVEILIFDCGDNWFEYLGKEFAESIRNEIVKQNITVRELGNSPTTDAMNDNGNCDWTSNLEYVLKHFRHRLVEKEKLFIEQDIYIIGSNKVHINGYREDEVMGIELISREYAGFMRQLFNNSWNQAKVIDKFGGEDV